MVFETVYILREAVLQARTCVQARIPISALKNAITELYEKDGIAIYSRDGDVDEDLRYLENQSLLTISGNKIIIDVNHFLEATRFAERQEELLKDNKYAAAILEKLRQKARALQVQWC